MDMVGDKHISPYVVYSIPQICEITKRPKSSVIGWMNSGALASVPIGDTSKQRQRRHRGATGKAILTFLGSDTIALGTPPVARKNRQGLPKLSQLYEKNRAWPSLRKPVRRHPTNSIWRVD